MKDHVIITGAAGGLGSAVTRKFIESGYKVTALTQPGHDHQAERLKSITEDTSNLEVEPVDVLNEEAMANFFENQESIHAGIFLVGGFTMGDLSSTTEADLDKMIALNFKTAFHSVKNALPKMAEGGRIFLIGARPATDPKAAAGLVAYSLSKGLVLQLAAIVNEEGASKNIQAVTVLPSIIDTPMNRKAMPDADFDKWVKPDAIAESMLFAVSEAGKKQRFGQFKMYGDV
ncbi:MAG: SDR family NAD(P)-dependent oxidoreductase [Phaeodactylibacter sp.]|nr:SDR family NAD(P)-dependent oxidoreductase [Phaeodactylibacter sp.]